MTSKESVLIIASSNYGKVKEFRDLLKDFPFTVREQPDSFFIEETGVSFKENARIKALAVAEATGELSLADDSGLSVVALAGAPGVYSARYAKNDNQRINRLLRELDHVTNRRAYFSAALCLASPLKGVLLEVEGRCEGVITQSPRGNGGFGYDPVFEVLDTGSTFAEMEPSQKKAVGHRGRAFALLRPRLQKLFL